MKPVKKKFLQMEYVVTCLDTKALRNCPIHKCVNELSIALIKILIAFPSHIIIYFEINRSCRSCDGFVVTQN